MAEKWKCLNCGGYNPGERNSCLGCGTRRPTVQEIKELEDKLQERRLREWRSAVEKRLLPGEQLRSFVPSLYFTLGFVPSIILSDNYGQSKLGALALTTHRLIAVWEEDRHSWQVLHILVINSLLEKPVRSDQPKPYQATIMTAGGMGLVMRTQTVSEDHAKQLLSLLSEGFTRFAARGIGADDIEAVIAYEEEKRLEEEKRQREMYDD